MSDSDSSDDGNVPKRKKGVVNEQKYKRNIIKKAKVEGNAYTSYSGKLVSQKTQTTITCKCSENCYSGISDNDKDELWSYFYSLESKNSQDVFLQTLIEKRDVKRRRNNRPCVNSQTEISDESDRSEIESIITTVPEQINKRTNKTKPKNNFFVYNLKLKGELKTVCKNSFMSLLGITASRVRRICNLLSLGKSPIDLRGRQRSGNALAGELCLKVHNHMSKFEVKETHYYKHPKKYLDARLSIKIKHEMFIKEHPELEKKVKYSFYRKYFIENFGYSFGRPQVDVCSSCENFKMKMKDQQISENAKRNIAAEYMIHQRRAKKFYTKMKECAANKDNDTVVIAFDYMQNQPLPLIPVQDIFYMRQLWVNIFCIHNLKNNKSDLYLYHEGQANKSPNEVCSFLWSYLSNCEPNIKKIILFSDGPSGQNKNHTVAKFLLGLCDTGRFESIIHYFPVRGHSFMACDRDFGTLKRAIRKCDRIYTPDQYAELFLKASKDSRFTIHHITTNDILNFKTWWPTHYKKNVISVETFGRTVRKEDKISFKVSKYKEFRYTHSQNLNEDSSGKVVAYKFIDAMFCDTFHFRNSDTVSFPPTNKAYPQGLVPINIKKIGDLKKLTDYIIGYEYFYNEILNWPTTTEDTENCDAGEDDK